MTYRSWLAAAAAAVAVLAVIVGVSLTSAGSPESPRRSGDRSAGPSPGGWSRGSPGESPGQAAPMPLPQPVAPPGRGQGPGRHLGVSIQSYELPAPDRLHLRYTAGAPECHGSLDRAAVRQTARAVTVTLVLREPAAAQSRACPGPPVVQDTTVALGRPLGDRVVLDGGTQRPVRSGHHPR